MMLYINELFENAFQAMVNLGEYPVTGELLEDFIDIDSCTRLHKDVDVSWHMIYYPYA